MRVKRVARTILFCAVLLLSLNTVYRVLAWKDTAGEYYSSVDTFYGLEEDLIDVLFLGSSHCYCSIDNSRLWEDYGIASFSLAVSGQDLVSSYYTFAEALKTQKPDVVCLEMYGAVFQGYGNIGNLYRNTLPFRMSANSYAAVRALVKEDDPMDYFLKWPIVHTRYAELKREDFISDLPVYIGYHAEFNTQEIWEPAPYGGQTPAAIAEENEQYVRKLIELAQEEGIGVCLFVAPYAADDGAQSYYRYAEGIAQEYGVAFMNLTDPGEGLSLDLHSDFIDFAHTNYYGAQKVTSHLGEYLKTAYDLPDRRGDERYVLWDEDAIVRLHEVQNYEGFPRIYDLRAYLDYIGRVSGYTVFVCTEGEYLAENVELSMDLGMLGIGEEFWDGHHVWVFDDGELSYLSGEGDILHYADLTKGEYAVGGTSEKPTVHIDRENRLVVENGINIVVYDNLLGKTVDAVGFDAMQQYTAVR